MLESLWPPSTLRITVRSATTGVNLVALMDEHLADVCTINIADIYGDEVPDHAFPWIFHTSPIVGMQFRWANRSNMKPNDWSFDLVVLDEHTGEFLGTVDMRATDFATTRRIETVSWVLHKFQGQGCGTLIRRGICEYGFSALGAKIMRSAWGSNNIASARVSAKLGYQVVEEIQVPFGPESQLAPGVRAELARSQYRPDPAVTVEITGHTPELHALLV